MNVKFLRGLKGLSFWRREDGASAAEFAMVVMPLTILTLTIVEVGSMFFAYNDMHNTARETVRRAAVDERLDIPAGVFRCDGSGTAPPTNSVQEIACGWGGGWINSYDVVAELGAISEASLTCRTLTVRLSTTMDQIALFDVFGILAGKSIQAEATMITEYTVGGANFCT